MIVAELTALFTTDNSQRVWDRDDIKSALLNMNSNKCCYCECRISEESKYMEVDHFRCKDQHPHLVVDWGNLLPSCKRCNGRKGDHNVETEGMIIDPTLSDPGEHLWLQPNYRLRHKDEIGRNTISVLDLNNSQRVVLKRFEVAQSVAEALEAIRVKTEIYIERPLVPGRRTRLLNGIRNILDEALSDREYAATAATEILRNVDFVWIKDALVERREWPLDLQHAEDLASTLALSG